MKPCPLCRAAVSETAQFPPNSPFCASCGRNSAQVRANPTLPPGAVEYSDLAGPPRAEQSSNTGPAQNSGAPAAGWSSGGASQHSGVYDIPAMSQVPRRDVQPTSSVNYGSPPAVPRQTNVGYGAPQPGPPQAGSGFGAAPLVQHNVASADSATGYRPQQNPVYVAPNPQGFQSGSATPGAQAVMADNNSGSNGPVPAEVTAMGWSWGGFGCGFVWLLAHNQVAIGVIWLVASLMLAFTPLAGLSNLVTIVAMVYFGLNANRLGWQRRKFQSVEHYKVVEGIWAKWGIGLTVLFVLVELAYIAALMTPQTPTYTPTYPTYQ